MRIAGLEFRPRPLPGVLVAIGLLVLGALGVWQLERAEDKRVLLERYEARRQGPPIELDSPPRPGEDLRYYRVRVTGRFDAGRHYLLDNQLHHGRLGFEVITPLRLRGSPAAVLVDRGWVPMGRTRRELPDIPTAEGRVSLVGTLREPPQSGMRLGPPDVAGAGWPRVIQYVDVERVSDQLDYPVARYTLALAEEQPHGFVRRWEPVVIGPGRHLGYAVQWFGLALALAVFYVVLSTRRVRGEGPR
ncbi:MAG: SURF1 family protein [Gammaproteobacteria bacterium]|nr:SURF1 family protein [Gammaproteobacteria bacterium]